MSLRTLPPRDPEQKAVAIERRRAIRHACLREISCQAVMAGKDDNAPALLQDLSTGGLRLELRRCYEPGCVLTVSCRHPSDGSNVTLLAHVIYARNEGSGNWAVGCTLINALTEKELASLL
jgi:hypothetical protein